MPSFESTESALVPLAKAIEATSLDSHVYAVHLQGCFAIGTVPNGGYASSTLLQAAHLHLAPRKQPDTVTVHFEFVNPTEVGPGVVVVEEVKLGRTLSVLHVSLYQRGLLPHHPWITPGVSRKEIVAYVTNGDIASEQGVSVPTSFLPITPEVPRVDLALLPAGKDALWQRMALPPGPFGKIRSLQNMEYYVPRAGQPRQDGIDLWMRLASGGRFTNASLAYVVDAWPYIVEQYRPAFPGTKPYKFDQAFWYPTVALNIEVKRALPAEGVEWVFMRERAKMVKNGRYDIEVVVLDAQGELVAVASHVAMIVDSSRNLNRGKGKSKAEGKL
jgi:acyl-coenzyme A thioesterase PaaI-like protein